MKSTSHPKRLQLFTCMVAVAAAMLLAPVSAAGTEAGPAQAGAYSVPDSSSRTAADRGSATKAESIAAEAAVARIADEAQTRLEDERAAAAAREEALVRAAAEEASRLQAEAAAAAAAGRVIHVAYAGGQDVVNMGVGPVLFPLSGWPPYVAEHDFHGGWDRIGSLAPGMTVTMTGLVTGTYTVGEIINVPRGGKKSDLTFNVIPKVMLQTCIPGTNRMVVVGLY